MELSLKNCATAVIKHLLPILLVSVFLFVTVFTYFIYNKKTEYTYLVTFNNNMSETSSQGGVTSGNYSIQSFYILVISTQIDLLDKADFFKYIANDSAVKALGKNYSASQLRSIVKFVQTNEDAANFTATIRAESKQDAKVISEAILMYVPQYLTKYNQAYGNQAVGNPEESNVTTTSPLSQGLKAFILAFVILCAVFILREALDTRIKSEKEITAKFNIPVLGSIPSFLYDAKMKGSEL
ncbi:MAG TPA: hypothetical protein DCY74_02840 [Clostridiales bacterium]|jgi:capsular polysaccharide biosynthesis protein|nr:hypothetical protein [Clostridiales bacterium]HBE13089.1 hypothetical protein [Clostridiales bacterium]